MTKSKNTKRALLMSVLSMMLCVAMLAGSTFAWFTDSVTSGVNKIVAGNLDVELEYRPITVNEDGTTTLGEWTPVDSAKSLFKPTEGDGATLWEPGHTEYVKLRIRNAGTLALKYNFELNVFADEAGTKDEKEYTNKDGGKFKLSDYLVFNKAAANVDVTKRENLWIANAEAEKAAMGTKSFATINEADQKLLPDASKEFTLAVYMPTWVGNQANQLTSAKATEGEPTIYLGLNLMATQTPHENDSFGNDYDANIQFPLTDANGVSYTIASTDDGKIVFTAKDASAVKFTADPTTKEMTLTNGKNYSGDIKIPSTVTDGAGNAYTLTTIGDNAFDGNASLKSIIIPDSVVSIGSSAFEGCSSLESLIIPNANVVMRNHNFQGCTALNYVVVSEAIAPDEIWDDGTVFEGFPITDIGPAYFMNCNSLEAVYYWTTEYTITDITNTSNLNDGYLNAKKYVYSETEPVATDKPKALVSFDGGISTKPLEYWYWHMVEGVPTPWPETAT